MLSTVQPLRRPQRPTAFSEHLTAHFRTARQVFLVAAPVGAIVGVAIAGYDYIVNVVLRERFTHLLPLPFLCLLPVAGLMLTGTILSLFRVPSSSMADEVVLAYHQPDSGIAYRAAIPKFAASIATMGFAASAGMEGASKRLGATISSFIQYIVNRIPLLRWLHGKVETTMLAGAAAGISARFWAPLTGAIMASEPPYKHDLAHDSLIHGLIAAATSYATFSIFRPATPYFPITFVYHFRARNLLFYIPLGLVGGLTSHVFLASLAKVKRIWGRWPAPGVFKLFVGSLIVAAIAEGTYCVVRETHHTSGWIACGKWAP